MGKLEHQTKLRKKNNGNPNKRFHYRSDRARPIMGQQAAELQAFGTIARLPNGLSEKGGRAANAGTRFWAIR